jgi:hypothetical protein|tara:strand:+ start:440 stop:607 length:168 start_codon:yes stop_codon:yes gene_type:complete
MNEASGEHAGQVATEPDELLEEFAKGGSSIPSSEEILAQMLDSKEGQALNESSDD